MKYLRWVGLVSGLLFVGVLGGLLAPLPSEAVPEITIGGTPINNLTSRSCDTGFNSCWTIPTGTYGGWTVGNSTGQTARIMLQDNAGAGTATDKMKLSGFTFTKSGGGQLVIVFKNRFNAAANASNDFQFALTSGGVFDPPSNETTRNNRVRLSGRITLGTDLTAFTALPGAKDTGLFQTLATDLDSNTSWSFSQTASSVGTCNNGNNQCTPIIEETLTFNVVGNDLGTVDNSAFSNFGTCREQGPPSDVPPGPPDPLPPGVPCKALQNKMQQENNAVLKEEMKSAEAANATPFIPCTEECGEEDE